MLVAVGWVAGPTIGLLLIACDGTVAPTLPTRTAELSAVTSGAGRFVAVGASFWSADGVVPNSDTALIVSSADGVTWETAAVASAGWLHAVAYGGGRFVAMGSHDVNAAGPPTSTPVLYTSLDGRSWEAVESPSLQWRSVTYGADRFVALGIDLTTLLTVIATSPDGLTWTDDLVTDILSAEVTFGNGSFVLWGETGAVGVSANGSDWEVVPVDSVNRVTSVAYLNGAFAGSAHYDCCFGELPELVAYYDVLSADGRSWTVRRRTEPAETFFDFAFGTNRFIAVGASALFSSADGVTWQRALEPGTHINDIAYARSRFVGVGRMVWTSSDGLQWTAVDLFR